MTTTDRRRWLPAIAVALPLLASCTPQAFFNNTAPLGSNTPGDRDNVQVSFINNTPYRAIFTFGTMDLQNQDTTPHFDQFTALDDPTRRLEGNTSSDPFTFQCARTLAVGTARLKELIELRNLVDANTDEQALRVGVAFSDKPLDDPDAGEPTKGVLDGFNVLQGYDFPCESLVVITFNLISEEPFQVAADVNVILPGNP